MTDPTLVSRLLRIADQLSSALDVSRERLHHVSQQSKRLESSAEEVSSNEASEHSEEEVPPFISTDEEGYVRPSSPPLDEDSKAYVQWLQNAYMTLQEDHALAMQTIHILMSKIRTQQQEVDHRVGKLHRDALDWADSARDVLDDQMRQNTQLTESLHIAYRGIESAALAADDALHNRALREYTAQLKQENEGLRAVLRPSVQR